MEYYDILLIILQIVFSGVLFWLGGFAEKRKNPKWRVCYLVPVIITLIIMAMNGFEINMLGAYTGSAVCLAGFIKESVKIRRISSAIAAVLAAVSIPVCLLSGSYRIYDYARDFKNGFDHMKKYYVLSEHKGIDWDGLYDEFLPRFEEVNRLQDEMENTIVWTEFCARFNDGHVGFVPSGDYELTMTEMYDKVLGNDYGFAPMTLSDGRTVAVNVGVDTEAYNAGIRNGTVITGRDGVAPENIDDEAMKYFTFADKDNKEFYRTLICGGTGGDSITVTFLDESGNEKSAVLQKIGAYYSGRMKDAMKAVNGGIETGHLMWEEIDENTSALRLKMMMSDSKSMKSDNYDSLSWSIESQIEEMKEAGKNHIILDMRDNAGGSDEMVKAIASIFASEGEHYYCTDPVWDYMKKCYVTDENGNFVKGTDNYYTGRQLWDGKVTILVNANSVSAADHTVLVMKGLENVTIMGFTEPNGSAQGVGSIVFKNESGISFSGSLLLDENGNPSVDSGADYESGNDVDVIVPFDEDAVRVIFDEGGDYLLQKALEY